MRRKRLKGQCILSLREFADVAIQVQVALRSQQQLQLLLVQHLQLLLLLASNGLLTGFTMYQFIQRRQ
ncbi:hypothetical protein [Arsukibacterium sp. MJ3]|uniref:hypothetical protein n=1 Tax=Arsukibacterium sp. MJ3 TaxID=1632859 RepID=UPI00128CAD65|nr:hypothetical protein [Arsukibacterium sp. MJ3]